MKNHNPAKKAPGPIRPQSGGTRVSAPITPIRVPKRGK